MITKQCNVSVSPGTYSKFHMDVTLTDFFLKLGQLNLCFSKQIEKQWHSNVMRYHLIIVPDVLGSWPHTLKTSSSYTLPQNFQLQKDLQIFTCELPPAVGVFSALNRAASKCWGVNTWWEQPSIACSLASFLVSLLQFPDCFLELPPKEAICIHVCLSICSGGTQPMTVITWWLGGICCCLMKSLWNNDTWKDCN